MRTRFLPEYEEALLWYTTRPHVSLVSGNIYEADIPTLRSEWRHLADKCDEHPIVVLGNLLERYGLIDKECMGISPAGLEYLQYYELVRLEELLFCPNIITRNVVAKYFNENKN